MENTYFTAAQAREAAGKKAWINLCNRVNQVIIEAYEKGNYGAFFVTDNAEIGMLDRMVRWLEELGYSTWVVFDYENVDNDLYICWQHAKPMGKNEHPRTEYITPLKATDAKKYSDEHSKRELTLKNILDKVSELADVGIYRHTFPLASFCEHNAIRPSTIDRLQELGYNICVKNDRLEVNWSEVSRKEKNDKYLLTAWDAHWRADTHNYSVAEQIETVLTTIHDKSTNEGLFEHIAYVSYPETLIELEKLGYKVTVLPTDLSGHKIKVYWGE